jgi:hypothetical protein
MSDTQRYGRVPGDDGDGDDVEDLATEEHNEKSSKNRREQLSFVKIASRVFQLLKHVVSFMFFSARDLAVDATGGMLRFEADSVTDNVDWLHGPTQTSNNCNRQGDTYQRVFRLKLMCLETMGMPRALVERYKNVHDPDTVATLDSVVNVMNAHRVAFQMLSDIMEHKTADILEESEVQWKEKMSQHKAIIQLCANLLVNTLTGTKEDKLVMMVDATSQSRAESQLRRALIDLNKSMLTATQIEQTANPTENGELSHIKQAAAWTPTVSEDDIKHQQRAIAKQTRSEPALLA